MLVRLQNFRKQIINWFFTSRPKISNFAAELQLEDGIAKLTKITIDSHVSCSENQIAKYLKEKLKSAVTHIQDFKYFIYLNFIYRLRVNNALSSIGIQVHFGILNIY